jgi:predicted MPP superfamily phosphohydrolase
MSKLYRCDKCGKVSDSTDGLLEISSSNSSITITNNAPCNNTKQIAQYSDLHFCGRQCLDGYLFKPINQTEELLFALTNESKRVIYEGSAIITDAFRTIIKTIEEQTKDKWHSR